MVQIVELEKEDLSGELLLFQGYNEIMHLEAQVYGLHQELDKVKRYLFVKICHMFS